MLLGETTNLLPCFQKPDKKKKKAVIEAFMVKLYFKIKHDYTAPIQSKQCV